MKKKIKKGLIFIIILVFIGITVEMCFFNNSSYANYKNMADSVTLANQSYNNVKDWEYYSDTEKSILGSNNSGATGSNDDLRYHYLNLICMEPSSNDSMFERLLSG